MQTIRTLYGTRELIANKDVVRIIFIASFILMTTLGAYVRIPIPFSPVPMTLQTFFVILCGAMLGRKYAFFTQSLYVGLGTLGMPVFQGYGAGLLHLAGPTGGYLAGFIAATSVIGILVDRRRNVCNFSYVMFAMLLGLLAIYFCGVAWLMVGYRFNLIQAVSLGVIPFLPGAAVKLIAAAWIYSKLKTRTDYLLG